MMSNVTNLDNLPRGDHPFDRILSLFFQAAQPNLLPVGYRRRLRRFQRAFESYRSKVAVSDPKFWIFNSPTFAENFMHFLDRHQNATDKDWIWLERVPAELGCSGDTLSNYLRKFPAGEGGCFYIFPHAGRAITINMKRIRVQ